MKAMVFEGPGRPLRLMERSIPEYSPDQVLIRVSACGVCRTDLHVVDGDLKEPKLPLVLGHEIVGVVEAVGERVEGLELGQRVGVPWLGGTCAECAYCKRDQENLCDQAVFTGYQIDGGYAEYAVADHRYAFPLASGTVRCRSGAASLRRSHRLPLPVHDRRGAETGTVRIWRRRPHHRPGGAASRSRGLRLHSTGGHRGPGIRSSTRSAMGRRLQYASPHRVGRGHSLCTRRRARPSGACCRAQGRRGRLRRDSYELRSLPSTTPCSGESDAFDR